MTKGWHILRDEARITLTRRLPPRFDVESRTTLPPMRAVPLAHIIRQDVWRALRNVRGFSPVVEITPSPEGLLVRAGGRIEGNFRKETSRFAHITPILLAILDNSRNRRRWGNCARERAE